jgi:hypothetical protein
MPVSWNRSSSSASTRGAVPDAESTAEAERLAKIIDLIDSANASSLLSRRVGLSVAAALFTVVCIAAAIPYSPIRVNVEAVSSDVVIWLRYQDIFLNLNIEEMFVKNARIQTTALDPVEHKSKDMAGDVHISGGSIKPDLYTGLAEGLAAIHYDQQRHQFKITLDVPKGDIPLIISLDGANLTISDKAVSYESTDRRIFLFHNASKGGNDTDSRNKFIDGKIVVYLRSISDEITLLQQTKAKRLRFVEPARYDGDDYTWLYGSRLQSGSIQFLTIPGATYTLRPYEEFQSEDQNGILRSMRLTEKAIHTSYTSDASNVEVGEFENPVTIMPSYLDYIRSRPYINSVYAVTASIIVVIFGLMSWWARRR